MTISSTTRKAGPFPGNGVTTAFPFDFKVFKKEDVLVTFTSSVGADSALVLDSDYSVTLNLDQDNNPGGTITYPRVGSTLPVLVSLEKLTVTGDLPLTQPTDIPNLSPYFPQVVEDALDRAEIQIQQVQEQVDRCIKIGVSDTPLPALPGPQGRANEVIGFDPLGNLTLYPIPASIGAGDMRVDVFTAGTDFTPGVTTQLVLSRAPGVAANAEVFFDALFQGPDQWSVNGVELNFTDAIPVGVTRVYVRMGTTLSMMVPAAGSITDDMVAQASNLFNRIHDTISVKDFGAGADKTAAQNKTAFKLAVAAVPAGGVLLVPNDGAPYVVDATGGLSDAVDINKRMTLRFEGDVKSNYGTMQANPPYIFKVSAVGVSFIGPGSLIGNESIDDTNAGDDTTFPGLVYVTGDRFNMVGMTVDTPPKLAVLLVSCKNARISHNNFIGGPTSYTTGHTAYFAVRAYLGSHHMLDGNHFAASPAGGKYISCIFGLQSHYMTVIGNTANGVWEKLTYLYGNGNRVIGNVVNDTTITDAFRFGSGSYNQLIGNLAFNVNGGTQMFDGVDNLIADNIFVGCRQIGINVTRSDPAYTGGFSGTKIKNNICVGGTGLKTDGIRFWPDGADSIDADISGNIVSNFAQTLGEGLISVKALGAFTLSDSRIADNVMDTGLNGIVLDRVVDSKISGNQAKAITNYFLTETNAAGNRWLDNHGRNIGVLGISGLSATSYGRGNQYTRAPLIGKATLAAAITTTVTHGGVAPNAIITLQEMNSAAGLMVVAKGRCYTSPSGTNFSIAVANGTAAAGTEQFAYEVLQ